MTQPPRRPFFAVSLVLSAMLLSSFNIQSIGTASGEAPQELGGFTMSPIGLQMRLQHS